MRVQIKRLLLSLLLCQMASAEFPPSSFPPDEPYLSPKSRKHEEPRPEPEAEASSEDEEYPEEKSEFTRRMRFSAHLGYSALSSSNATASSQINGYYLRDHFLMGLNADVQFTRTWGAEADGFITTMPNQYISVGGSSYPRQMQQWGLLFGARVEMILQRENSVWRPRVLLGYGLLNTTQTSTTSTSHGSQSIQVGGVFVGLGLEGELGASTLLFADFCLSLLASGSASDTGFTNTSTAAGSPSFNRLRLGANWKIWGPLRLGPLLVLRSISTNITPDASPELIGATNSLLQAAVQVTAEF